MRIGIHSGPVTAGVLRGERSRFQVSLVVQNLYRISTDPAGWFLNRVSFRLHSSLGTR